MADSVAVSVCVGGLGAGTGLTGGLSFVLILSRNARVVVVRAVCA